MGFQFCVDTMKVYIMVLLGIFLHLKVYQSTPIIKAQGMRSIATPLDWKNAKPIYTGSCVEEKKWWEVWKTKCYSNEDIDLSPVAPGERGAGGEARRKRLKRLRRLRRQRRQRRMGNTKIFFYGSFISCKKT